MATMTFDQLEQLVLQLQTRVTALEQSAGNAITKNATKGVTAEDIEENTKARKKIEEESSDDYEPPSD